MPTQAPQQNLTEYKQCLSQFPTGVTIATTAYNQSPIGVTISSFCSVSLQPPLILFCLEKNSQSCSAFKASQYFNIHILEKNQQYLSQLFASHNPEKWNQCNYSLNQYNIPLIQDTKATIQCKSHDIFPGGDHFIIVGYVYDFHYDTNRPPLLYYKSDYNKINY